MASIKIKKWDPKTGEGTLSYYARQYETTVDDLMRLNIGNPAVKSKDIILAGGNLTIPDIGQQKPGTVTSLAPVAPGPGEQPPGTVPVLPSADITASFAAMGADIKKAGEAALALAPTGEETPEMKTARETRLATIGTRFGAAREEVSDIEALGRLQLGRAQELLGLSPAAIRYNVDEYSQKYTNFSNSVSRAIESLTIEETAAIANENYQYAETLRQQKLDYANIQRQMMMDSFNFMTNAYNMMLTGKQFQRQEEADEQTKATNILNMLQASGVKYENLSPEDKASFDNAAATLGISPEAISNILGQPGDAHYVSKGDYIYVFDKKGNQIRAPIYTPTGVPGSNVEIYQGWLDGYIDKPGEKYQPAVQSQINQENKSFVGGSALRFRETETSRIKSILKGVGANDPGAALDSAILAREAEIDNVVEQLSRYPDKVAQALGLLMSIQTVSPDMKETLREAVREKFEELFSNAYITNTIKKITIPGYFEMGPPGTIPE